MGECSFWVRFYDGRSEEERQHAVPVTLAPPHGDADELLAAGARSPDAIACHNVFGEPETACLAIMRKTSGPFGDANTVLAALRAGVNVRNDPRYLIYCIKYCCSSPAILRELADRGAPACGMATVDGECGAHLALREAILKQTDAATLRELVRAGESLDVLCDWQGFGETIERPLHYAVRCRRKHAVRALLECGADPLLHDVANRDIVAFARYFLTTRAGREKPHYAAEVRECVAVVEQWQSRKL